MRHTHVNLISPVWYIFLLFTSITKPPGWFPYKKVNVERSNTKGTGLGIAISRTILELHKFSYGVNNNEDGVTFWFRWI